MLTSAREPFCATTVINDDTERAAAMFPETFIGTLSSLGKTFPGNANLVQPCIQPDQTLRAREMKVTININF